MYFLLTLLILQLHTNAQGETIQTVQQLGDGHENMTVDLTEATLGQDGQIIITGEDGQGNYITIFGKIIWIYYFTNWNIELLLFRLSSIS